MNVKQLLSQKKFRILLIAALVFVVLIAFVIALRDEVIPGWHTDGEDTYYVKFPFVRASGITEIGGKDYYFSTYGDHELLYGFNKLEGNRYYSDENGVIAKGEHSVDGVKYFFYEDTGVLYRDQVVILKGKLWYFNEYGYPVDAIVDLDGEKFFFKATGGLKKGLVKQDGKTYYFDKTKEHMLTSQFVTADDATYYFGADGAALTGEQVIDGVTYRFDADGKQIA